MECVMHGALDTVVSDAWCPEYCRECVVYGTWRMVQSVIVQNGGAGCDIIVDQTEAQ